MKAARRQPSRRLFFNWYERVVVTDDPLLYSAASIRQGYPACVLPVVVVRETIRGRGEAGGSARQKR